jgi:hypothetical protein
MTGRLDDIHLRCFESEGVRCGGPSLLYFRTHESRETRLIYGRVLGCDINGVLVSVFGFVWLSFRSRLGLSRKSSVNSVPWHILDEDKVTHFSNQHVVSYFITHAAAL